MSRRLTANIVLTDPNTGSPVVFEAGQEVPKWAADLITNEDLFEGKDAKAPKADKSAPSATAQDEQGADDTDDEGDLGDGADAPLPPKTGTGSGVKAWRAYALGKGFEFDDDVKREEIIAALDAENIPTE